MPKVAIIGANGQVGAELCLLLSVKPAIELVPICRNRSGSAFLRWQGIACRHGRVADVVDARRLLADCDIVVNSSLAAGTPAQIRHAEDRIVTNMIAFSKPGATIVHFSTQTVYGDPRPAQLIRWRNPYGRVKLATERRTRSAAKKWGKRAFILRLGHVCGQMQEISNAIRSQIRNGEVVLPADDCSSNTVYTAAIVQAIEQIIDGRTPPGTYDLMNTPRWSWRQVYEFEANACGHPLMPTIADAAFPSGRGAARRLLRLFGTDLVARQPIRNVFAKLFAYVPATANARALAWWYVKRARTEIAALETNLLPAEHLSWVLNGSRFFPADVTTIEMLQIDSPMTCAGPPRPWAPDLPDAGEGA